MKHSMKSAHINFILALLFISLSWSYAGERSAIEYSSVQEALEDLKNKPGVDIKDRNGWTVINQTGNKEIIIWSFAPPSHSAYPAVAKRRLYEKSGVMVVDLNILCESSQAACNFFLDQFKKNDQIVQGDPGKSQQQAPAQPDKWVPNEKQQAAANALAQQYLKLRDDGRYQEAYELLAPIMQNMMSFREWSRHAEDFRIASGGNAIHEVAKMSWHKDPVNAAQPGVYATLEINCRYQNIPVCTEVLILHQHSTGEFRVMRHEQNIVDPEAGKKVLED